MKRVARVLFGLLSVLALPEPTLAAPGSARRVDVQVVGGALPGIEASLKESFGRLALDLHFERRTTPTRPIEAGATAQVWVMVSPAGDVSLVVRDEASGVVVEQRELKATGPELLVEQLTLLIRTALESRLEPRTSQPSVGDFSALASSPAPPRDDPAAAPTLVAPEPPAKQPFGALEATQPPAWDPKDGGAAADTEKRASGGVLWGLEPQVALRWWSPDLEARRLAALGLSAEVPDITASPGIQLGFGYYDNAVGDSSILSFDIETQEAWLMGQATLVRDTSWALAVRSGPTLLWSLANVRSSAPGYAAATPRTHWDLV
ncbi:MAG: hypothetical protein KC492_23025, partial [Myxococcales bacterium]|nr:hypothetical protein [Myxococcales bacterium]